jgi:hypothetical protein
LSETANDIFTYNAASIRVKTIQPDGTIIDTPFPGYEVENPGLSSQTVRLTFAMAGQPVALQVLTSSSSNTYFLYNDHLGSLTAVNSGSTLVSGSRTYYDPFGNYRGTPPSQTLTGRGYTGQKENMELGLLYYNAGYYVPFNWAICQRRYPHPQSHQPPILQPLLVCGKPPS